MRPIEYRELYVMIRLEPFTPNDFKTVISWIHSKELLVTIAGTVFTFPLTEDQLQKYLDDEKSCSFNVVDTAKNKNIGHAEIYLTGNGTCKLDKVLIGDKSNRGKGIGLLLIDELVSYSFTRLGVGMVELNVYDWNASAKKCYEKAGFTLNPDKKMSTEVDGISWNALNMTITKDQWDQRVKV